jgi:hypothetical protein
VLVSVAWRHCEGRLGEPHAQLGENRIQSDLRDAQALPLILELPVERPDARDQLGDPPGGVVARSTTGLQLAADLVAMSPGIRERTELGRNGLRDVRAPRHDRFEDTLDLLALTGELRALLHTRS